MSPDRRTYDPGVAPLLLAAAGVVALAVALALLRGFGPRYRVGRLLAVAPRVSVAEAVALATTGDARYVRVDGRIDSDAEFEDADHRPLVLRRTTLAWRPSGSQDEWTTFDASTEAVAFVVREGLDEIGVEGDRLAEGLVVVPRVSRGRVGDLGERAPDAVDPDAEAQLAVEQVSSVEQATVAGVPRLAGDARAVIGPGLGRPLVLTTLERDEAMRVLTGGATGRSRAAFALLVLGTLLVVAGVGWWVVEQLVGGGVAAALAASPDPSLRPGSDTRTPGQGPGLVGEPLLAILGVLGLGLVSVAASLAYVRLTGGRRESNPRSRGGRPPSR